ncbi:MAG: UDP-N-acetylmuramate dehydrogenase [bacterium]|nr:UDP-N-acetylmuramate dehydrogenase [bacterium]
MTDDVFEHLKKELSAVQKNIPLKDHTTFKIGGPAEYFCIAQNKDEVVKAINAAKKLGLSVFVFGGGSNLLVADEGLKGLVIKIENKGGVVIEGERLTGPTGISMQEVVEASVNASLEGVEWAGGLPGSFGGAVRGNAGAFGGEMKDTVIEVQALDDTLALRTFSNEECHFSYRNSIFKEKGWVVISVTLQLKKGGKTKLREIAEARKAYRQKNHPLQYPSAGSVFKNIPVQDIPMQFMDEFKGKVKQDPFPIVPAAWFIIGAGLTGKQIGGAQISEQHSNYIINRGGARAKDVLDLAFFVEEKVKEKYDIDLEMEVQYVK